MADPLSLVAGVVGIGSTIAGGAAQAASASAQGQQNASMYNYQAGIAQQNQQIALQNADYARQTGENQAGIQGVADRVKMGQVVEAQAASGFNINSGTAVNVRAGQQLASDQDLARIRSNAAKTAYDYDVGAAQDSSQASAYSASAKNALTAGTISTVGSIVGTAGSVASKWLQGSQQGLWNTSNVLN